MYYIMNMLRDMFQRDFGNPEVCPEASTPRSLPRSISLSRLTHVAFTVLAFTLPTSAAVMVSTARASTATSKDDPPLQLRQAKTSVTIEASTTSWKWKLHVTNRETAPVRFLADLRTMRLLVRQPASAQYHTCELPRDVRPDDPSRWLTLAPGASYEETFDPRLYCWGTKRSSLLVPGASVTALLGEPPPRKTRWRRNKRSSNYILEPAFAGESFTPMRRLASLTLWLPQDFTPSTSSKHVVGGKHVKKIIKTPYRNSKLTATAPSWLDAHSERNVWVSVRLKNTGTDSQLVHMRPDNLVLRVTGPDGKTTQCGPGPQHRAAVRDFFRALKPGRSRQLQMRLREYCPSSTFARPGLYQLHEQIRLNQDGAEFGFRALKGVFNVPHPTLLRVRHGSLPWYANKPRVVGAPKPH